MKIGNVTAIASLSSLPPCLSNHFTARLAAIVPAATPALLGSHYSNHFTARLAAIVPAATPALLGSHYSNHFTARLAAIVPAVTPALPGSHYRIANNSGTSLATSSARLIESSIWLIATWIFCTGRRRLQRAICGQSLSLSIHSTMLIGPSSARTTCPTEISAGRRASAYPPFGPL